MASVWADARAAALHHSTVLLIGESGTGKEVVANQIHLLSQRASGPFVVVDCTTLRDTLLESQLFGHVRGAFTGADRAATGFFRTASGGTLFLDEIGELAPPAQAKLLRALQERTIVPLGGTERITIDVRLIAATHRDLREMVRHGTFRQDLYYRLNVVRLRVPALRERIDDLPQLAAHFLSGLAAAYARPAPRLSEESEDAFLRYAWPGNVRELANVLERAFIMCRGDVIEPSHLPEELHEALSVGHRNGSPQGLLTLADAERQAIVEALRTARGNRAKAARLLSIDPRRLARKARLYRISHAEH